MHVTIDTRWLISNISIIILTLISLTSSLHHDIVVENTTGATNQDRRTNDGVRGGRHDDAATSVKTGSVRGRGGRGIDNDSASVLLASVLLTCLLLAVRPTTSGHFRGGRGSGRRGRGGRDGSRGELS